MPRAATYTRAYAEQPGFLTLVSDGERLTGAYALGPEAGEWLQQATLAIRARVPLDVLRDMIQPFPTFSEVFLARARGARRQGPGGGMSAMPVTEPVVTLAVATDAHEGPVFVADEGALYFTSTPRAGRRRDPPPVPARRAQ